MRFPNDNSIAEFLDHCWQKKPLYMPSALDAGPPVLPADELAWLATQDDVESRLVFVEQTPAGSAYRIEHGPFDEQTLAGLPERNWTLLVQDVDKHLPAFREWLSLVSFVPDWRFDDLMISFAAPGGGVGPHRDNYDVFLCQVSGDREWRLAESSAELRPMPSADLALLEEFTDPAPVVAAQGDVLYLPPGVPHWGIAVCPCMTYSIGMRAPTREELRSSFERQFPAAANPFGAIGTDSGGSAHFYGDPDLRYGESSGGEISAQAIERCRGLTMPGIHVDDRSLAVALGSAVTDPKAWLSPDELPDEEVRDVVASLRHGGTLRVHGMARIAWWSGGGATLAFGNGWQREVSPPQLSGIKSMCARRRLDLVEPDADLYGDLLPWLLERGILDPAADDENSSQ